MKWIVNLNYSIATEAICPAVVETKMSWTLTNNGSILDLTLDSYSL